MPRPAVRSMVIIKYTAIAGVTATVTAMIVAAWLTAAISDVVAAAHRDVEWQFGRHAFVERISLSATHTHTHRLGRISVCRWQRTKLRILAPSS